MTYRELYANALRTVAEDPTLTDTSDYEDRAGYILATFVTQCARADAEYRRAHRLSSSSVNAPLYVDLDDTFPLSDVFAPAAVYYLSAMLTLDENEEMSDQCFSLYTDTLASIDASLPALRESITDCYGLF